MAVLNVLVERSPHEVWSVLSDGWSYAEWVAGTREIRKVDEHWPEVGAQIHYTFAIGPLRMEDTTTVRLVEPEKRLELEAHAGRIGTARTSFVILPWGDTGTVVIFDEHPLSGTGAQWHSILIDLLLRFRNRRMLSTLAAVVEGRHPRS